MLCLEGWLNDQNTVTGVWIDKNNKHPIMGVLVYMPDNNTRILTVILKDLDYNNMGRNSTFGIKFDFYHTRNNAKQKKTQKGHHAPADGRF